MLNIFKHLWVPFFMLFILSAGPALAEDSASITQDEFGDVTIGVGIGGGYNPIARNGEQPVGENAQFTTIDFFVQGRLSSFYRLGVEVSYKSMALFLLNPSVRIWVSNEFDFYRGDIFNFSGIAAVGFHLMYLDTVDFYTGKKLYPAFSLGIGFGFDWRITSLVSFKTTLLGEYHYHKGYWEMPSQDDSKRDIEWIEDEGKHSLFGGEILFSVVFHI